jgi:hypothetical protein
MEEPIDLREGTVTAAGVWRDVERCATEGSGLSELLDDLIPVLLGQPGRTCAAVRDAQQNPPSWVSTRAKRLLDAAVGTGLFTRRS